MHGIFRLFKPSSLITQSSLKVFSPVWARFRPPSRSVKSRSLVYTRPFSKRGEDLALQLHHPIWLNQSSCNMQCLAFHIPVFHWVWKWSSHWPNSPANHCLVSFKQITEPSSELFAEIEVTEDGGLHRSWWWELASRVSSSYSAWATVEDQIKD